MSFIKYIRLLAKYYFSKKPAGSPVKDEDFDIYTGEFDDEEFFSQLETSDGYKEVEISHGNKCLPVSSFHFNKKKGDNKLLVFATVHGNEIATAFALLELLKDIRLNDELYKNCELKIVGSVNPVGLVYKSRYNGSGHDINRDFKDFQTKEATLQRDIILDFKPDIVVSFHEGPQQGFLLITTKLVKKRTKESILKDLTDQNIELAKRSIVKLPIFKKGIMNEGVFITNIKKLLRINTLGTFTNSLGIPLITTESSWESKDIKSRVMPHIVTIKSIINTMNI